MRKTEVKKGLRVHINKTFTGTLRTYEGTIIGISRKGLPVILLDGYKKPQTFHWTYVDIIKDNKDTCLVCNKEIPPGPDFCGTECEEKYNKSQTK